MAKKPAKPTKAKAAAKKAPAPKATVKKTAKKVLKPARPKKAVKKATKKAPEPARPKKAVKKVSGVAKPAPSEGLSRKTTAQRREDILKKQLIQSREEIVKEAKTEIGKYIKGETRQLVESVLDDGDWSVIDLSEDINLRRLATHREVLLKTDEALRKIKEGTYGKCEDCGEDINTERLRVLPFAIYCRDCQEKREELEKIGGEEL